MGHCLNLREHFSQLQLWRHGKNTTLAWESKQTLQRPASLSPDLSPCDSDGADGFASVPLLWLGTALSCPVLGRCFFRKNYDDFKRSRVKNYSLPFDYEGRIHKETVRWVHTLTGESEISRFLLSTAGVSTFRTSFTTTTSWSGKSSTTTIDAFSFPEVSSIAIISHVSQGITTHNTE